MNDLSAKDSESGDSCEEDSIERIISLRPKVIAKRRFRGPTSNSPIKTEEDGVFEENRNNNVGKLWEETTVMRSLEEKMCSGNASSIANLRDRGVETYALDLGTNKYKKKNRKRRCSTDIYDSIMGEDMKDIKEKSEPLEEQLWCADNESTSTETHANQPKTWHKRKGNQFKRFKDSKQHQKQYKEFVPPENFLPRRLLPVAYDKQKLFDTVLDETLDVEQLTDKLVEALGEKEPELIHKAVEVIGKKASIEIFNKCQEVENQGGMLTKKADRRRTPGGVFMQIFSERTDVRDELKKEVFSLGNKLMKKKKNESKKMFKEKRRQANNKQINQMENHPTYIKNDLPTTSEVFKSDIKQEIEPIKQENEPIKQEIEPINQENESIKQEIKSDDTSMSH